MAGKTKGKNLQQEITLYMPEDVIGQMKQVAKRHNRSFNDEVVLALQTYLTYFLENRNAKKTVLI